MKSLVLYRFGKNPGGARRCATLTAAIEIFASQAGRIAMKVRGKSASAVVFDARPRWYLCGSIQSEDTVGRWHPIARSLGPGSAVMLFRRERN